MIRIASYTSTLAAWLRRTAIFTASAAALWQAGAQEAAVDDSAWSSLSSRALNNLPAAFILRPTHFASAGAGGGGFVGAGGKMLGRALSLKMLLSVAYDIDDTRVVLPAVSSEGAFDLLMTTPDASKEKLQVEVAQRLGYTGRVEKRNTDVLLVKLKQAGAPGLRPSLGNRSGGVSARSAATGSATGSRSRTINFQNVPISVLLKNLQPFFDKPLVDRAGLTGNYDATLEISTGAGVAERDAVAKALPAQLGLELVPTREAMDMLIVERAK